MYKLSKLGFTFTISLLVGFMAMVQWSLVPAQNKLSPTGYTILEQGMNSVMKTLTPALMIPSLVFGFVVVVFSFLKKSNVKLFYVFAVLSLVAMIVSTLIINAPINNAIDTWNSASPPAEWETLRNRWEWGHAIRSYIGLMGLFLVTLANIWEKKN